MLPLVSLIYSSSFGLMVLIFMQLLVEDVILYSNYSCSLECMLLYLTIILKQSYITISLVGMDLIFQSRGNYPALGLGKRNFEEKLDDSVLGVAHLWDSKRQKGLNYGPLEMGVKNIGHCRPVLPAQNLVTSNFQLGSQNGTPLAGADLPVISDDFYGNRAICGFCQSSRISEVNFC